jgi:hypothetical protein
VAALPFRAARVSEVFAVITILILYTKNDEAMFKRAPAEPPPVSP